MDWGNKLRGNLMIEYTIEQYDKTGKMISKCDINESVDIFNINELMPHINSMNDSMHTAVIKDYRSNVKVLYYINARVKCLITYEDTTKKDECCNDILTFRDECQLDEIYNSLARVKGWPLLDELPSVRGGDNTIASKIKRYVNGIGIKEIKYTLLDSSPEPLVLYP